MELFKKRESLTENIAYMGIMAAINVIAVILMNYVFPLLFIPFVLVMPLTSTIVTLFCKKKYFIFYAIATLGICFLVTINNITDTLFYVLPSIVSGFLFGVALSYRLPSALAIFMTALTNVGLTYISIPIINAIYGQNVILVIAKLFRIESFQYLDFVVPTFILLISIIQETLSFAFIESELPKLGIKEEENKLPYFNHIVGLLGALLSFVCFLAKESFFSTFTLFFLVIALFFAVSEVLYSAFKKDFRILIIDGIIALISMIVFGVCYQYVPSPFGLVLLNILFVLLIVASLVNNCLTKTNKSVQ